MLEPNERVKGDCTMSLESARYEDWTVFVVKHSEPMRTKFGMH